MNIKELKKLIAPLPDAMSFVLGDMSMDEENCILKIEPTAIGVEEVIKNDSDEEVVKVLLLSINHPEE